MNGPQWTAVSRKETKGISNHPDISDVSDKEDAYL